MEMQVRLADANDAEALAKLNQLFNGGDSKIGPRNRGEYAREQ